MSRSELAQNLLVAGLFGIVVPWKKGIEFLDSFLLLAFSSISFLFVAPGAVAAVFEARARREQGALAAGVLRAIARGWLTGAALLVLGLITVNIGHAGPGIVLPPPATLLSVLVFSLLGSVIAGGLAARLSQLVDSEKAATRGLRISFLLLLCLLFYLPRLLPEEWKDALVLQLTAEGLARWTLAASPFLALAGGLLLASVVRRANRGRLSD